MTQIATLLQTSILQGPRGIGARSAGGSYDGGAQQDIQDGDAFQGPLIVLTGSTDIINPHASGNYLIDTAGVDAMTLAAPTSEVDDNLSIVIASDTANAHTLTCPSALFKSGAAAKTVYTFQAFGGAFIALRAIDGFWHVIAVSLGVTLAGNFA